MSVKFLCGVAMTVSFAAQPALAVPRDFKAQADRLLAESWKADGPGAAVIVTERGKTVYLAGRGMADLEAKTSITPDTVFRIGSITKQFAAATLLQLVAEGKVSLDDPVSKFLPDYPQPGADATVRQLLNHTSGIMSYTGIPGWMVEANTNRAFTTEQMIGEFKDLPSPAKPGDAWDYNNSGYVLVGAIIEKVTGKPWHQAVSERLAAPLKLSTLRYGVGEEQVPGMAKGYALNEQGKFELAQKIHMSVPHAAGALIGTVKDLGAWASALHHGKVLPAPTYQAMITPAKLNNGSTSPYGFGLQLQELRGMKVIGHGGGIFGFVTASTYLPEKDVFVAVFTNVTPPVTSPDVVAAKLAALAAGSPFPAFSKQPVNTAALQPMFGVYKTSDGVERTFYADEGKLFVKREGRAQEVFPAGDNRFFYGDGLNWFALTDGATAPVMELHRLEAAAPVTSTRTGPVPPEPKQANVPRATLERYAGSYTVGNAVAVVALGEEGLTVKLGPQPTLRLLARSQTDFEVDKVGATVTFNAGATGPATSMTVDQGGRKMEAKRTN